MVACWDGGESQCHRRWNFKHIVNFDRILKFNGVNVTNGYSQIAIHSPLELDYYDANEDL